MATLAWSNQFCRPRHSLPFRAPFSKPSSLGSTIFALRASFKDSSSSSSSSSSSAPSSSSLDVSVFRFTLGIPGFDDSDLPRVLGIAFGAVLLLNHFLTADYVTAAQWRSELIGLCDAVVSISLPSIGKSLNGGTSNNAASLMPRSRQIFALSKNLLLEEKEDLAWGSYALLKNTKTTSLVIWKEGLICARGFWDVPQEAQGDVLEWLEKTLKKSSLFTYKTLTYVPFKADKLGWELIPNGVVCSLFLPFKGSAVGESNTADSMVKNAFILLLSNIPNAFNQKDLLWAESLSNKILKSRSQVF